MRITIEGLSWAVDGTPIISGIDARIASGQTVGLIGPNGSGKSTLLRCVAGLRTPTSGSVHYGDQDIRGWPARRIAQHVAFVEQAVEADSDLRVSDVVALGRTPFRDRWSGLQHADRTIVDAAMARMGLAGLRSRVWKTLSGGERQRAHLARALAQQPRGILLDEPTNHLDIRHQLELMELLATGDQTVLVALHDLELAARFCDRLLLLHRGALVADGTPEDVLDPRLLREVFEIEAEVRQDSLGRLTLAYHRAVPASY